jgi:hypothetical protein
MGNYAALVFIALIGSGCAELAPVRLDDAQVSTPTRASGPTEFDVDVKGNAADDAKRGASRFVRDELEARLGRPPANAPRTETKLDVAFTAETSMVGYTPPSLSLSLRSRGDGVDEKSEKKIDLTTPDDALYGALRWVDVVGIAVAGAVGLASTALLPIGGLGLIVLVPAVLAGVAGLAAYGYAEGVVAPSMRAQQTKAASAALLALVDDHATALAHAIARAKPPQPLAPPPTSPPTPTPTPTGPAVAATAGAMTTKRTTTTTTTAATTPTAPAPIGTAPIAATKAASAATPTATTPTAKTSTTTTTASAATTPATPVAIPKPTPSPYYWRALVDGQEMTYAPVEMTRAVKKGVIHTNTLVAPPGASEWVEARTIPAVAALLVP